MDFSPLRKSLKSHGSYRHGRRLSSSGGGSSSILELNPFNSEEQPILVQEDDTGSSAFNSQHYDYRFHHHQRSPTVERQASLEDTRAAEIIVTVDRGADCQHDPSSRRDGCVQREFSFDVTQSAALSVPSELEDSPSRSPSKFLAQRNSEAEISLDVDEEMEELKRRSPNSYSIFPIVTESPSSTSAKVSREIRVSFEPSSFSGSGNVEVESVRRRYKDSSEGNSKNEGIRDPEVLRCTSNASFRRQASGLARLKTRSRLLDPPEEFDKMSGRNSKQSGPFMSGLLGRLVEDEEEDPLDIDDLPDEYKRNKINIFTVLQWLGLIIILGSLICTLAIHKLKIRKLADLPLWKWEVLFLVLICGRLVSGWGIRIVVFFIERNFMLRKRVLYFVYGLRKGVQNCLWLGLVLFSWQALFDKKVNQRTSSKSERFLKYVTKVLDCFQVGNLIWLLKTLLVKVLASSFHVSTYFDRIQESLFYQYIIGSLSGPPLIEIRRNEEELERTAAEVRMLQNAGATMPPDLRAAAFPQGYRSRRQVDSSVALSQKSFRAGKSFKLSRQLSRKSEKCRAAGGSDDGITMEHLHKLNIKNVSAWNMKRLIQIVRYGTLLTLDEQISGNEVCDDESGMEIRNEHQAKAAARKIFYNVAGESSKLATALLSWTLLAKMFLPWHLSGTGTFTWRI